MINCSLSFHSEPQGNYKHNNRTIKTKADKDYEEKNNWYWSENESPYEFYERELEPYWREKNNNQKRKDRRHEEKYIEYLTKKCEEESNKIQQLKSEGKSKYEWSKYKKSKKPYYEIIVALGNINDNKEFGKGGEKQKIAVEILKQYAETFNKRNPNMKGFNFAIHTGEQGVAHLHLQYTPVAKDKKGNPEVSLKGALREMEYETSNEDSKRICGIEKWEQDERQYLKYLCIEHDINIISGNSSKEHKQLEEYKMEQDIKKINKQKEKLEVIKQEISNFEKTGKKEQFKEHMDLLEYRKAEREKREMINELWEEYKVVSKSYWNNYHRQKEEILNNKFELEHNIKEAQKKLIDDYLNFSFGIFGIIGYIISLIRNLLLTNKIKDLEYKLKEIKQREDEINDIRREISKKQDITKQQLKSEDINRIIKSMDNWEQSVKNINAELLDIIINKPRREQQLKEDREIKSLLSIIEEEQDEEEI